jgi:DNA repair protein RecO (recombination protein O)
VIHTTSGIVLASRFLGEADVVCSVLTADSGKRDFIFKGLRKSKKRSLAAKEPGTIISLVFYSHPERDLCVIKECSIIEAHGVFHENLDKIYQLYFILEVVDKTTGDGPADQKIYTLLEGAIRSLALASDHAFLSPFFLLHLLRIHGLLPRFGECATCGSVNPQSFYIHSPDLRQVCAKCAPSTLAGLSTKSGQFRGFSRSAGEFIAASQLMKFSNMEFARYTAREISDLFDVLVSFVEQYYHVKLNSKGYILTG